MTHATATELSPAAESGAAGPVGEVAPLAEPLCAPLAEAAVLGCLLQTTPATARQVLAGLTEQDWSVPQHAHIARAIRALLDQGVPVDPVTVLGQLRRQGLENAHTASTDAGMLLVELCHTAPTIANAHHYTRIVLEHSYRRRIQTAALRLLRAAEHASLDALTELTRCEHDAITHQQQRLAAVAPVTDPATGLPRRLARPDVTEVVAASGDGTLTNTREEGRMNGMESTRPLPPAGEVDQLVPSGKSLLTIGNTAPG